MSKINLRNESLLKFLPAASLILSSGGPGREGKKLFCRMFGVITGNPVAGTPSGEEEHRPTINSCLKFSSKKLMSPYVIRGSAEPGPVPFSLRGRFPSRKLAPPNEINKPALRYRLGLLAGLKAFLPVRSQPPSWLGDAWWPSERNFSTDASPFPSPFPLPSPFHPSTNFIPFLFFSFSSEGTQRNFLYARSLKIYFYPRSGNNFGTYVFIFPLYLSFLPTFLSLFAEDWK